MLPGVCMCECVREGGGGLDTHSNQQRAEPCRRLLRKDGGVLQRAFHSRKFLVLHLLEQVDQLLHQTASHPPPPPPHPTPDLSPLPTHPPVSHLGSHTMHMRARACIETSSHRAPPTYQTPHKPLDSMTQSVQQAPPLSPPLSHITSHPRNGLQPTAFGPLHTAPGLTRPHAPLALPAPPPSFEGLLPTHIALEPPPPRKGSRPPPLLPTLTMKPSPPPLLHSPARVGSGV